MSEEKNWNYVTIPTHARPWYCGTTLTKLRRFNPKVIIKRELRAGQMSPRFYGKAYYDIVSDTAYYYPFPLFFLVRWYYSIRWFIFKHRPSLLEEREKEIWEKAHRTIWDSFDKAVDRRVELVMRVVLAREEK